LFRKPKQALRVERGRRKIEKQKEAALTEIKTKQNETITKLNVQYQTAVKAKKTFGYVGIISLLILYGAILLNDLVEIVHAYL
jgi:hypothetical protein